MQIRFGALLKLDSASFNNPVTGQKDSLSDDMGFTIRGAFKQPVAAFILENTRDEVVITGKRAQTGGDTPTDVFDMQINWGDSVPKPPSNTSITIGFNPFEECAPNPGKTFGLLDGVNRVLTEIIYKSNEVREFLSQNSQS